MFVRSQLTEIENLVTADKQKQSDKNRVILMTRSNKTLRELKRRLGRVQHVSATTYHSAKGLQGEIAIMVEDCQFPQPHILRESIYRSAGIFPQHLTYNSTMRDETCRLAYVGVTRGCRRTFWFLSDTSGASGELFRWNQPVMTLDELFAARC
jgi:superfamily I DNA/RNA helicase